MDLIIIPFHDWRKSEKEGFRTRDVHFIKGIENSCRVKTILVINRPSTWFELKVKKQSKRLNGDLIISNGNFTLTKVSRKVFVADYNSSDILGQVFKKHLWFVDKYCEANYINFINDCCKKLGMDYPNLILQNIFASQLAINLMAKNKIFDAWDNFLKFPAYVNYRDQLSHMYEELSIKITLWVTNSNENIEFYKRQFKVKNIFLIKNGVKLNFNLGEHIIPKDMQEIKKPIIGFGGKITYLIDFELINHITKHNPDKSFVFVGQILDKGIYKQIKKRENVFFLGDKKYEVYPNYVKSFDVCIVPYNINDGQHGGDSMKAYEYLTTGKKVIGTNGNGLQDLKEYLYLAYNREDFSKLLKNIENEKPKINLEEYSWDTKVTLLLNLFKE